MSEKLSARQARNNIVHDMMRAHDMSVKEFAEALGVGETTIRSAINSERVTPFVKRKVEAVFKYDDTFFAYMIEKDRKRREYLERLEAEALREWDDQEADDDGTPFFDHDNDEDEDPYDYSEADAEYLEELNGDASA